MPNSAPNLSGAAIKTVDLIYPNGTLRDTYALTSLTEPAAAAPEPASMGLIALGLAGVAVTAGRRRCTTR